MHRTTLLHTTKFEIAMPRKDKLCCKDVAKLNPCIVAYHGRAGVEYPGERDRKPFVGARGQERVRENIAQTNETKPGQTSTSNPSTPTHPCAPCTPPTLGPDLCYLLGQLEFEVRVVEHIQEVDTTDGQVVVFALKGDCQLALRRGAARGGDGDVLCLWRAFVGGSGVAGGSQGAGGGGTRS